MINKIKNILKIITNLILFINLKGRHNLFKQFHPEINLPSCYTLDPDDYWQRSSDLPEFIVDDIKSQTLEIIKTESKFKKLKFDKLRVNFEVRYSKNPLVIASWQRSIWLSLAERAKTKTTIR